MQITNARYINPENTIADMTVTDDHGISFPFTFNPLDPHGLAPEIKRLRDEGAFTIADYVAPAPAPPLAPKSISKEQFLAILHRKNVVTKVEAIAAAQTGAVPAFLATRFDLLAEPAKTDAYVSFAAGAQVKRNSPMILLIQQQKGLTDDQVDTFFREAAEL